MQAIMTAEQNQENQIWFNRVQLAKRLGISRMTLYRWVKSGKCPSPADKGLFKGRFDIRVIEGENNSNQEIHNA